MCEITSRKKLKWFLKVEFKMYTYIHTESELNFHNVGLFNFPIHSMRADRTVKQELKRGQTQPGIRPKSTHSHLPKPQLRFASSTANLETIFQQDLGRGPGPTPQEVILGSCTPEVVTFTQHTVFKEPLIN